MRLYKKILILPTVLFLVSCGSSGSGTHSTNTLETTSTGTVITSGDITTIQFNQNSGANLSFPSGSSDDYLLVVASTDQTNTDLAVQLTSGADPSLVTTPAALTIEDKLDENPGSQLDLYLRAMETVLNEDDQYEKAVTSSQEALTTNPTVGSTQSFRVLSTLNSITTYQEVTAELRKVTDDLYMYVDQDAADNITDADLQKLAHSFGDISLPRERSIIGHESDINNDGHVSILATCVVNKMATDKGWVTGFFNPADYHVRSGANPASNNQEIVYVMVPDPNGKCGIPVSSNFVINNILPGVIAHEFQHLLSYYIQAFQFKKGPKDPWLNECLSHFVEDYTGNGSENYSRLKQGLDHASTTPLVAPTSPTLAERGLCYSFIRYLYEQSSDGDAFISNFYKTGQTGADAVETAYNGQDANFKTMADFIRDWSITLALSETGITEDAHYNFKTRGTDADTGNATGICVHCTANDGRGTVLDGPAITTVNTYPNSSTIKQTAPQFYHLKAPSGTVQISVGSDTNLTGAMVKLATN